MCMQQQIVEVDKIRKIQNAIDGTTKGLIKVVDKNMMDKCSLHRQAINDGNNLFRPNFLHRNNI